MRYTGHALLAGAVKVSEIRNALAEMDLEDICTLSEDRILRVEEIKIDQGDINNACGLCEGEGPAEPEDAVDPNLIGDFIAAINRGGVWRPRRPFAAACSMA